MSLYDSELYMEDVRYVAGLNLPWEKLRNKSILLSGATGLLGSFLVDVLMERNVAGLNCEVHALGRNKEKADARFSKYASDPHLVFIPYDVKRPFVRDDIGTVDYVLHLASNTHPVQYATDPIGTITTNIIGLQNMLDFAVEHHASRFAFASSNEIYGENRGDTEFFDENYCGYINSNTLRAGYPESKRCGEALCQAYKIQKGLDVVVPRFTRSYGPTMLMSDTKALSQFIKKGIAGEDIVLKSAGTQYTVISMSRILYPVCCQFCFAVKAARHTTSRRSILISCLRISQPSLRGSTENQSCLKYLMRWKPLDTARPPRPDWTGTNSRN